MITDVKKVHRKTRCYIDDSMFSQIIEHRKSGMSVYNISFMLGLGTGTVTKRIARAKKLNLL